MLCGIRNFTNVCVANMFEWQAEQTPDAVAVVFEGKHLTYQELHCRSNQLAHYLVGLGVGPEVLVGVYLERSPEMVVALLAILKAGGAYVPLDPAYPQERLAFMLEDSQVPLLLSQSSLVESLPKYQARTICLDADGEAIASECTENVVRNLGLDNLAYVIYTSGSTGKPKGVEIEHQGLQNLILWHQQAFDVSAADRSTQLAGIGFDASVWELWPYLTAGATIYIANEETRLSPVQLQKWLIESNITLAFLPTPMTERILLLDWPSNVALRILLTGGDKLHQYPSPSLPFKVVNNYGPTEYTVVTTSGAVNGQQGTTTAPHIGRPIANTQVYLLDEQMQPVPLGEPGEMYIGGMSLARGYLKRPDLTAERFITNPFSDGISDRLYKTGDLVRYLPDGNLDFIGRVDHQVKIRGFRIEIGEIEATLRQHSEVREAVVTVREDTPGNKQLVAYVVSNLMLDRIPLRSPCLVETEDKDTLEVITEDISIGGIGLVNVPDTWKQGQPIRLRFDLPGVANKLWFSGQIAWIFGQKAGVQFVLTAQEQFAIEQSIDYFLETQGLNKALQRTIITSLRNFLKQKLPDYMLPSNFVLLKALPLNANGKVDRQALLTLGCNCFCAESNNDLATFPTPDEQLVAAIWAKVLKLRHVGIQQNFFELGGHSLLAADIVTRLRNAYQIDLPISCIFEFPTVAELAKCIDTGGWQELQVQRPPIQRRTDKSALALSRHQGLPLSFNQQQQWFFAQLEPDLPIYNEPVSLHRIGALNVAVLEQCLNEIIRRHEALRTNFLMVDGQPVQIVAPPPNFILPVVDLSNLPPEQQEIESVQLATAQAKRPFNLATDLLLRATLVKLGEEEYKLYMTIHHIIFDGVSLHTIFLKELKALYAAFLAGKPSPLPELTIQYPDFAAWDVEWRNRPEVMQSQIDYWQKQLGGNLPVLQLPTDHPRPARESFRGTRECLVIPKSLTEALRQLSQREGATLFMTMLTAFKTLLYRYSGQEDIIVGSYTSGRNRPDVENLIGFFPNTIVLRSDLSGNPSFRELLKRVRNVALEAYAHQDLPFQKLVDIIQPERNLHHNPLFQVAFILEPPLATEELEWQPSQFDIHNTAAKFDLALGLDEREQGVIGRLEYNTDLFEQATIQQFIAQYLNLLEAIAANPDQSIAQLPLLTAAQQQQILVEWNNTQVDYSLSQCLHQLFEQQAEKHPLAVAVTFKNQKLTYQQLNQRANQLAHYLQRLGVKPDVPVGIFVERSLDMIVGLLGILKAGGAYVPIDPGYANERSHFMLADAQVQVLLTQKHLAEKLSISGVHTVYLDTDWTDISSSSADNPVGEVTPNHLAYIIYTSGSTGKPKGVQINHASVVNLFETTRPLFNFGEHDAWTVFHSYAFDFSVWEIWGALVNGAKLVIVPVELTQSPPEFYELLCQEQVTVLNQTPSAIRQLIQVKAKATNSVPNLSLRLLICGGEALPADLALELLQWNIPLWNFYGPTEATVWAAINQVKSVNSTDGAIPIGRPLPNTQLYILDANLQPVPIGIPGELYIGGSGLARGYLNRPDLTSDRFIRNPFANGRLYKTGDLALYLPDGNIEYISRIDHQVKIRGFRIELGEIESVIKQHPAVQTAVVIDREDIPGQKRLVAYIVPNADSESIQEKAESSRPITAQLRSFLRDKLPEYMLPTAFVYLEKLPLTSNSKIDRKALPVPEQTSSISNAELIEPRTPIEKQMFSLWAQVLRNENFGIGHNFFEIGGNSLLAAQLIMSVREQFQVELPLRCLFEHPTIEGLCQAVNIFNQQGLAALTSAIDLNAEVVLPAEISPSGTLVNNFSDPNHIFLTGATGFLGAYLLQELLLQTKAKIYCLVRAANELDGLKRLQKNLEKYLIWDEKLSSRIIPICGDLAQPLLGLSTEQFEKLAHQIDSIYHSGATVNFIKPYSLLKAANVLGTQDVLRLACLGKVKPVYHVSTTSVLGTLGYFTGVNLCYEDDDISNKAAYQYLGYVESKWVAENLVLTAKSRGVPVMLFRTGLMLGHTETGISNIATDYVCKLLKACIQMQAYPEIDKLEDFVPVDYASKAIVHISRQPELLGKTFHVVNPQHIHFDEFFDLIRAYGYPVQKLPYSQWKNILIEATRHSQDNPLYPLLYMHTEKVYQDLTTLELYQKRPFFDCQNTLNGLAGTSIVCPDIDTKLIDTYFSYFIRSGFLPAPVKPSAFTH